jgi:hypothetical protein
LCVIALRRCTSGVIGCRQTGRRTGREVTKLIFSRTALERQARDGESPVGDKGETSWAAFLSTAGHEEPRGKSGGPPSKAKYSWRPIVHKYREGKVKSTPGGE